MTTKLTLTLGDATIVLEHDGEAATPAMPTTPKATAADVPQPEPKAARAPKEPRQPRQPKAAQTPAKLVLAQVRKLATEGRIEEARAVCVGRGWDPSKTDRRLADVPQDVSQVAAQPTKSAQPPKRRPTKAAQPKAAAPKAPKATATTSTESTQRPVDQPAVPQPKAAKLSRTQRITQEAAADARDTLLDSFGVTATTAGFLAAPKGRWKGMSAKLDEAELELVLMELLVVDESPLLAQHDELARKVGDAVGFFEALTAVDVLV